MIAYIQGNVTYKQTSSIIVETHGIGYEVFVTDSILQSVNETDDITLFVYHHIFEGGQALYGFKAKEEREFFLLLTSVSGIGPKGGLAMVDVSISTIVNAIFHGDIDTLVELPGIGKKTAERMVLELQGKVGDFSNTLKMKDYNTGTPNTPLTNVEALDALLALGYSRLEANRMIAQVPVNITQAQDIVKHALQAK